MWNKFAEIQQDPSIRRLGIAVCVSAILHTFLFGAFSLRLPSLKKEMHLIEARILMPKAVAQQKKTSIIETQELVQAIEPNSEQALSGKTSKLEADNEIASLDNTADTSEPVLPINASEILPPVLQQESSEDSLKQIEQPVDFGLVVNQNAYQYVETEFDVRTEVDGITQGKASIIYSLGEDNHYQLTWLTKGTGLAALFFPELLQTSEGLLNKSGLQPIKYIYQFGDKASKTHTADFDWQSKTIVMQSSKGVKTEQLPDDTQDLLSFMYQFMYVAPLQNMQIPIATGKKLSIYEYSFEGEESLNSPLGELKAVHILHSGTDLDEKTELWLAIDYQYLPIKIRKIEKNGNVVELEATRINTNRPTVDN
jgi:Protein of unknown function (DUF3108)